MRLIKSTQEQWERERRWEAAECAAQVIFVHNRSVAVFFSGDHILYSRMFEERET
jgi:hypothetical protein